MLRGKTTAGNHCCVLCLVAQSCPTLCNPMDCSPPGSSVHGDSLGKNTRVGCHAFLQGLFPTRDQTQVSHIAGGFFIFKPPGKPKNTGVGSLFHLQGNFPTQELNHGLLHCRWILYQLNFQGSPRGLPRKQREPQCCLCRQIYYLNRRSSTSGNSVPQGASGNIWRPFLNWKSILLASSG